MGRPKKKRIAMSQDSMRDILQEAYNEAVEQRITGIREANKLLVPKSDEDDFGFTNKAKIAVDLLKLVDSAIDKKIKIATLQNQVVNQTQSHEEKTETTKITDEERTKIREMMESLNKGERPNLDV